ncbi:trimethyllysine dioxygenase [Exophiala viscosa]|uniref:Trimethyllysine dioxygenase n=1 Tax=Exophiala viscosa TaxID=2486360 RepID=A0AAN6E4Q2_9EURO|nr:trimethyllysine dioxygenase [Exophiala viscosa]
MKPQSSRALVRPGHKIQCQWRMQALRSFNTQRCTEKKPTKIASSLKRSPSLRRRLISSPWQSNPPLPRSLSTTSSVPQIMVNDMANQEVLVDFDGTAFRYPSFWLRDHCPCSECQHPSTHQRQLDTFTVDPEIKVSSAESTPSGLQITWPNNHTSLYSWSWLSTHPPFTQSSSKRAVRPPPTRQWTPSLPSSTLPQVPFPTIMDTSDTSGLTSFLSAIHNNGLCFIPSTPPNPSATQYLIERISHIRATHYGGFWDFTSEVNPIDTAYTNDPLPPHTDNTYFTDPAGLQLFHLLSHTSVHDTTQPGQGGESTFVDGFAAAAHLHKHFPQHYRYLATIPITSAALGAPEGSFYNTASSMQGYPVLNHSSPGGSVPNPSPSNLVQIRWNNLDRMAPTTPSFPSHTALKSWYAAAREWARILESPEFLITVKLQPGEPVIFDNWRVLHGRLGFEGKRRVCGAYVGMDDFRARCRSLGIDV